jgi:hypothetical protein
MLKSNLINKIEIDSFVDLIRLKEMYLDSNYIAEINIFILCYHFVAAEILYPTISAEYLKRLKRANVERNFNIKKQYTFSRTYTANNLCSKTVITEIQKSLT